jgi:hypothetical protein
MLRPQLTHSIARLSSSKAGRALGSRTCIGHTVCQQALSAGGGGDGVVGNGAPWPRRSRQRLRSEPGLSSGAGGGGARCARRQCHSGMGQSRPQGPTSSRSRYQRGKNVTGEPSCRGAAVHPSLPRQPVAVLPLKQVHRRPKSSCEEMDGGKCEIGVVERPTNPRASVGIPTN